MFYCEKCGAYNPKEAKICIQCGNKIEIEIEEVKHIINKKETKTIEIQEYTGIKKIFIEPKNKKVEKPKKEKLSRVDKKAKKKELKEAKNVSKDILTTTKDLLEFVDIDNEDRIITKTGIINLFQIQSKDIYSFSESDRNIHIFNFVHFIRGAEDDLKIIVMNFPVSTKVQQDNIIKNINKTNNEIYKTFLTEKLEELQSLEENRYNKEFYLMTFYKLDDDADEKDGKLEARRNRGMNLSKMNVEKKIRILHKLNNMNTKLF